MATYYLNADTGANGNPGTSALPWETFVYAESQMSNGDTVIAQDSAATYLFETVTVNVVITLVGESVEGVVFDGAGAVALWYIRNSVSIRNITFQNVTQAVAGDEGLFYIDTAAANTVLLVESCIFRDIAAGGNRGCVATLRGGTNLTGRFTGCLFYNFAMVNPSGIVGTVIGADPNSSLEMYNCSAYFDSLDVGAIDASIFVDVFGAGIGLLAVNCIFQNDAAFAMHCNYTAAYNVIQYDNDCTYGTWVNVPAGANNITDNPLFVDAGNDNFNLRPTSPCIDTGTLI